jgi:hypothetical protein
MGHADFCGARRLLVRRVGAPAFRRDFGVAAGFDLGFDFGFALRFAIADCAARKGGG